MFFAIPLILSLNAHAMVPYDSIGAIPLLLEIDQVVQVNYAVKQQQIVGELPHMSEIIQLAKNAATLLSSPPRIYSTSGNSVSLWPNQPEVVETSYGTSGVQPAPGKAFVSQGAPMTLRTLVEPIIDENYNVIFQSTWTEAGSLKSHAWRFRVSANHQATFIGEDGDALPPLRM